MNETVFEEKEEKELIIKREYQEPDSKRTNANKSMYVREITPVVNQYKIKYQNQIVGLGEK